MTPGKERGCDMFKLREKILRFGGKGDSHEEPVPGKGVRSTVGLLPVTPLTQKASAALGTGALPAPQRLPQCLRGWAEALSSESQCVCLELDPEGET